MTCVSAAQGCRQGHQSPCHAPRPVLSPFPPEDKVQAGMVSHSLLEILSNMSYKLETLPLLAEHSVGLDFHSEISGSTVPSCCSSQHCFLASLARGEVPPSTDCGSSLPSRAGPWGLECSLFLFPNSPHPACWEKMSFLSALVAELCQQPPNCASSVGVATNGSVLCRP